MLTSDIETNAINFKAPDPIAEIKVIHCVVIHDDKDDSTHRFNDQQGYSKRGTVVDALDWLAEASEYGGHNFAGFDVPAIQQLHPDFQPTGTLYDSLVLSELAYAKSLYWKDKGKGYGKLTGQHSLAAWGMRLGDHKDTYVADFAGFYADKEARAYAAFAHWTPAMEDYCVQDVAVNVKLFAKFKRMGLLDTEAARVDSMVRYIIGRQERRGFALDIPTARTLVSDLSAKREEQRATLSSRFPSFYLRDGKTFTPKRDNKTLGYVKDAPVTKVKMTDFNPASDDHTALVLQRQYGWKPKEFTDKGHAQVTETILKGMPYDIAPTLLQHRVLHKRLSQIAEADGSWLLLERDGRVHGRCHINGTRTARATHSDPNMSACPRVGNPFGAECRGLWIPGVGYSLVGVDLSGLELRCLAHYLGRFDGGALTRKILTPGYKPHQDWADILGCTYNGAKTYRFAMLYGAMDLKLGRTLYDDMTPAQRKDFGKPTEQRLRAYGKWSRAKLSAQVAGLEELTKGLNKAADRKWMLAMDGRRLYGFNKRTALNTLLQSAGAVVAKRWMVLTDNNIRRLGYRTSEDYAQVYWGHDELQFEARPAAAHDVKHAAILAAREAGEFYKTRCPMDAEGKEGASWAATH